MARLLATAALVAIAACTTYQDDLARGQKAFETHDYDRSLAIFRPLEGEQQHLSPEDRAHYAYFRGMTDYRIGFRADARHWLALAKTLEQETPGVLVPDWKRRMDEALSDLNDTVYTTGMQSLVDDETAGRNEDAPRTTQTAPLPLAPADAGSGNGGAADGASSD
jgi:hypothetical protein